jgi:hypothetical protein
MESAALQNTAAVPPVPPATPAQVTPGLSVQAMQGQYIDLTIQLAGLKAEWNGLSDQLGSMRLDNPARPAIQQQAADVGVKIAQTQGQLAALKGQIARQHGHVTTLPVSDLVRSQPWIDFDAARAPLALILAIVVLAPLSIGFARRMARGSRVQTIERPADPLAAGRMERLEQAVDSIAIEVERISENQRFMTRVLVERNESGESAAGTLPPGSDPV